MNFRWVVLKDNELYINKDDIVEMLRKVGDDWRGIDDDDVYKLLHNIADDFENFYPIDDNAIVERN